MKKHSHDFKIQNFKFLEISFFFTHFTLHIHISHVWVTSNLMEIQDTTLVTALGKCMVQGVVRVEISHLCMWD